MERPAAASVTVMMLVGLASSPAAQAVHPAASVTISAAECTTDRLGSLRKTIPHRMAASNEARTGVATATKELRKESA